MSASTKTIKPQNKGVKVFFNNPVLERLTRTSTAVPVSIFTSLSVFLMVWGFMYSQYSPFTQVMAFIIGLLLFTLVEYLVHRYLFHMITNTRLREKIQYAFHGVHHEFPKDTGRLAMPPIASVAITTMLFFTFRKIMGDYTFGFLPGFISGYSLYLIVHYVVHAYQPPKNIFRMLWINHGIHHYKDHERAFGVSSPLWDYIFRTTPKKSKSHS
jgi:sterol desaturase/sphingolipid hydroxylase (fatty acid hydroxylase superfamily)